MTRAQTPPARPRRSSILKGPGLVGLGLLGAALATSACDSARYTEAFTPEGDYQAVSLRVDHGDVELVAGEGVWVERTVRAAEGTLELSHDIVDGVLVLQARCTTPIPCAVDTVLQIPEGLPVSVELGSGSVWASGIAELDVQVGEGNLEVDLDGSLQAHVARGALVAVLSAGSRADLAVGSGDLSLGLEGGPWDLELQGRRVSVEGVVQVEGAEGRVSALAPGGQLVVLPAGDLSRR